MDCGCFDDAARLRAVISGTPRFIRDVRRYRSAVGDPSAFPLRTAGRQTDRRRLSRAGRRRQRALFLSRSLGSAEDIPSAAGAARGHRVPHRRLRGARPNFHADRGDQRPPLAKYCGRHEFHSSRRNELEQHCGRPHRIALIAARDRTLWPGTLQRSCRSAGVL